MAENTNNTSNAPEEPKTKVIKGTAKLEKKSVGKKVVDFLFSDKLDSISNYLAYYILGPSLKELIFKMVTGAAQMALFGGNTMVNNTNSNQPSYGYQPGRRDPTSYSNYSNPGYAQPQGYYQQRVGLGDISFDTKDDAYLVLDRMARELQRYGMVKVADYYNFAGVTGQESNWALQSSGWYNLGNAHPMMRTDGRWVIEFPPVQSLR